MLPHTLPPRLRVVVQAEPSSVFTVLVAVVAVCPGEELEGRRGLGPGVALLVAWVFELGS